MSDIGGIRSRSGSRAESRSKSRATSIDRAGSRNSKPSPKTVRKGNDPVLRRLEDIDPFELLHSTPDQLARQLGISRTAKVGNINQEIENIRTKSQVYYFYFFSSIKTHFEGYSRVRITHQARIFCQISAIN